LISTRALAIEYAAQGIRINTVSPGVVKTPMHEKDDHELLSQLHPIHRLAEISEIVGRHFISDIGNLRYWRNPAHRRRRPCGSLVRAKGPDRRIVALLFVA
jgi:NAD(P)-dependent dehydrogenase (short-subunit alcohol dehydrogenase family)